MSELGRISGPLLKSNLERHTVDLAFETDLIYLSVIDSGDPSKPVAVGIRNDSPQRALHIGNDIISEHRTFQTTNLIVDTQLEAPDITISGSKIENLVDPIVIAPNPLFTPTVETARIGTLNLRISDKLIENITNNSDINLTANGNGKVIFTTAEVDIDGNMHATGNITWDGTIIFGNSDTDNVTFNSDIASDLIPNVNNSYDLGTLLKQWNNFYTNDLVADTIETSTAVVNGINLLLTQGNVWYVSKNGIDTNTGDHLHSTFLTIKHALSQASAGDEILIFPGTYEETWPLEIPQGVTVKGSGIRGVTITPTSATNTEDCFLLNGETTVEFLTIKDFYSPGYAFALAPGYSSSTKSPYIYNVTVITAGIAGSSAPGTITVGPAPTGVSLTSDSVTLSKSFYSQPLVDSLVGQKAYIDRYPNPPLVYTVVSVDTEPLSPTEWRMTVDSTFNPTGQLRPISFYPDVGTTFIIPGDNFDTTGSSIGEPWVAYYKTNLPADFNTVVGADWSINVAGVVYVVDYVIEDPINTNMWRIYVTTSLVASSGIPIFSSPAVTPAVIAGGGAYIDGSVANPATVLPPTGLFYSTTFIVPGGSGIVATNKARVEWLNSFTYFAETGIRLETGTQGIGGSGNTIVTVADVTGTIDIGDTFTYYDQSGNVIKASGIVADVDGDVITLDGYVGDLDLITEVPPSTFTAIGTARLTQLNYKFETASLILNGSSYITSTDNIKFAVTDEDFCIEKWIYPVAFPTTECTIVSQWGSTAVEQAYKINLTSTGGIKVYLNDGSFTELSTGIEYLLSETGDIITDELGNPIISEDETIILNTWQHIAVVRNNDDITIYVGGVSKATVTLATGAVINDSTGSFSIGYTIGDLEYFNGYIDEFRLSVGESRFITEFTPPTTEYATVDTATSILLHFDGIESSVSFVDSSSPLQKIVFSNAIADRIVDLNYRDFAAEMRSINSANVYGTYGAVADGRDTLGYLIGHNFGYIGSGTDNSNDRSLVIQANEVVEIDFGKIYYDSVDHKGDYRIGDIFYVNQETGDVLFNAEAVNFLPTGNIVLEGPSGSTIINSQYVQTGNLRIYDNNIDSLTGPVNWNSFSGTTTLSTNVNVNGNIDILNDLVVDGNVYLGNDVLDTITFNSKINQDLIPDTTGLTLGEPGKLWETVYGSLFNIDNAIEINNNNISILTTNTNLVIDAAGTGVVYITDTNVDLNNDLTIGTGLTVNTDTSLQDTEIVGSTVHIGDIDQTGDYTLIGNLISGNYVVSGVSSYFEVPDIKILDNEILATALDDNLELFANGTGGVRLDNYLKITSTTISNVFSPATTDQEKSIIISPTGSGNLVIDSVRSLQVPSGNNSNRVLAGNGEIRFNSTFNGYEGFDRTGNVSLGGLYSQLRDTYITPELTVGANDNTLRFATNNVVRATLDSTKLYTPNILVDNISISGNTINNTSLTNNLIFSVSGTGNLNVNSLSITGDQIENLLNSALTLRSTGSGYVKFNGDAIVIPFGNDTQRRASPELGELRNNNDDPTSWTMEVFDGTTWIPAVGTSGAASLEEIEDTLNLYSLILG